MKDVWNNARQRLTVCAGRTLVEQKSSRSKLWAAFGVDQLMRKM